MESVLRVFRQADAEELPRGDILQLLKGLTNVENHDTVLDAYIARVPLEHGMVRMGPFLDWLAGSHLGQTDSEVQSELVVQALAHRGLTLRSLVGFMRRFPVLMPHYELDRTRTVDVVWQVIIPETAARGCAYAELLQDEKRLPDKMVSHNWGNLFSHLIAALFADAAGHTGFRQVLEWMRLGDAGWDLIEAQIQDAGKLDSSRWLCIFAVNQHISICNQTWGGKDACTEQLYTPCTCGKEKVHSGALCEMNKFDAMIELFKARCPKYEHVVAVDDGLYLLTRIWVIAEIAEVFRHELPCKVVLLEPRSQELLSNVQVMDVRNAQASRPEDVELILAKIPDKEEFNTRTRVALMVVAHLASLQLRAEMVELLKGISSPERDHRSLQQVDATRARLSQASNLQEVQEVWEDFERQSEKVSDADQIKMMNVFGLLREVNLTQPELFINTYRRAALPQMGFRPDMSDEDIMAGFWQMRTNVQSMSELPHVYVDGPAFMAVVVKSRKPHSTVICITCPHESLHVFFKMGEKVQMTESKFPSHLVTMVYRTPGPAQVVIHRGLNEPPVCYSGPFEEKPLAEFVVAEALPRFGPLHEVNRVHYLVQATAGLLAVWLGVDVGDVEAGVVEAMKAVAVDEAMQGIPCCLLERSPEVLKRFERFLGGERFSRPVAVLVLGQLGGRRFKTSSDQVKSFILPLELPLDPARLLGEIRSAQNQEGEAEVHESPLLGERFLQKIEPPRR
ncbi:unnamed protein product [Effrenium voratum]|nr:unnamed protein product [Effrenium voratum]